jgi:TadE-like protein
MAWFSTPSDTVWGGQHTVKNSRDGQACQAPGHLPLCAGPRCAKRRGREVGQGVVTRHAQRGAAVIEFALILPLLLLLLIGGIDMSLALYDKAVITNASREGARAGIVARTPPISEAEIRQVVQNYTQTALVNLGTGSPPSVSVEQGSLGADLTLRVSVSYTFQGIGLGDLFSALGQPWVLSSSTVMVYE